MKKLFSVLLAIALLFSVIPMTAVTSYAAEAGEPVGDASGYTGDDLKWFYSGTTHTLTISGTGEMSSTYLIPMPGQDKYKTNMLYEACVWSNVRDEIEHVVIGDGVTSIGDFAFWNCRNLKTVLLPETLTSIGVRAFENCDMLEFVELPQSVTRIDNRAFQNCDRLSELVLPEGLTSLGYESVLNCPLLKTIRLPDKCLIFTSGLGLMGSGIDGDTSDINVLVYVTNGSSAHNSIYGRRFTCVYSTVRTITYSANDGSGTMSAVKVYPGCPYRLRDCRYTAPSGKMFGGWRVNGTTYAAGDTVTVNSDTK